MLDEYLSLYEQRAATVDNWKKTNKNTLCKLYIENENDPNLSEAIFSAIVARYWPSISKMYQRCNFGISEEDCYHWLIDSVLYALKHRPWMDETSALYNDPNGPDKVINRCLKSRRLTHYQLLNKDKRVANLNIISIDDAADEFGDYANDALGLTETSDKPAVETVVDKMISGCVDQGNYFTALLLDAMLYTDVLEEPSDNQEEVLTLVSSRKLNKTLFEDFNSYIEDFTSRHPIGDAVKREIIDFVKNLSPRRVNILLDKSLSSLRTAKMRKLLYR